MRPLLRFGLRRRHKIPVGETLLQQLIRQLAMQIQPLRLPVEFVPSQFQPFQSGKNRIKRRLAIPVYVRIVDTQNHRTVMLAHIQPVKNESARAADM